MDNKAPSSKNTRAQRLKEASQQRRDQEKQEVRHAILQASSELFLEVGYQNFSLRQVAERIGYSPGTIYLYFNDKDAILFTIMEEGLLLFGQQLMQCLQGVTHPREKLARLGQGYVAFGLQHRAYYQLMFMQRTDFFSGGDAHTQAQRLAVFGMWQQIIVEAMQAGILRPGDASSVGDVLWGMLHGVVSIAILMPNFDEARVQAMTATAIELLTRGLHNPTE